MRQIQLVTDCEGPLALNDNAFELCRDFLQPQGDRFFRQVSRYGDYLADILKKTDYKAGNTLKLILPFLKAAGVTNDRLRDYSWKSMRLMPGVEGAYKFLHGLKFPIFEISTSYRQFAEAVGRKLGFAPDHIVATDLNLKKYHISDEEMAILVEMQEEITSAPEIELPLGAKTPEDLPGPVKEAIARLDRIFGEQLPALDAGVIYREVNPIGGAEKARALEESLARTGMTLKDTIYVGDSITDVRAFETVQAGGGLGISFNGNRDAVRAAEVIVVADNAWPIALLTCIFRLWGKEAVLEVARPDSPDKSKYLVLPDAEIEPLMRGLKGRNFNLYPADTLQKDKVVQESAAMRARLRGEAVAALG